MKRALAAALASAVLLGGCGTADKDAGSSSEEPTEPACQGATGPKALARIDVDGDGAGDAISFQAAAEAPGDDCAAADSLSIQVGKEDGEGYAELAYETELPVRAQDLRAVSLPGRAGDLVLVVQTHPRGGFAAHLNAWNGAGMTDVGGDRGLVPFIATDAPTQYVSAACTPGGFELTEAVAHAPIGVVPAWDVYRTPYTVDGNEVTAGARAEVADNVLEKDLQKKYSDLVHYRLFENCAS